MEPVVSEAACQEQSWSVLYGDDEHPLVAWVLAADGVAGLGADPRGPAEHVGEPDLGSGSHTMG